MFTLKESHIVSMGLDWLSCFLEQDGQTPNRKISWSSTIDTLTAIFGLHMGLLDSRNLADDVGNCSAPCCSEESVHA
ncbi:MAG: hypothetical protein V2I36_08050 [Desulfopila sp.]|nr:hypothetical protein [Desulfopila sp.]